MVIGYLKRPDDDAHRALGEFLGAWSELELSIEFIFQIVANPGDAGGMAYARLPFKDKVELFGEWLADCQFPEPEKGRAIECLKRLLQSSARLSQRRNRIVHAIWTEMHGVWCRVYVAIMSETWERATSKHPADQSFRDRNVFSVRKIRALSAHAYRIIDGLRAVEDVLRPLSPAQARLSELAERSRRQTS